MSLNPDDPRGIYVVAQMLAELGQREESLEWARRMMALAPDDPYILYGMVCILACIGEIEEAVTCFEQAVRRGFVQRAWIENNQWFDATSLPHSDGGFIRADRRARVEGVDRVYVAGDAGSFPGPDWMPKQAHMADLQAETAAKNLVAELRGEVPGATFRVELVCIVDSVNTGMLVARTERLNLMLPASPLFHWAKRAFERVYLRRYR